MSKPGMQSTVYVVDDDPRVRQSLESWIEAKGHAVRSFASAGAFHRHYQAHLPGCLVHGLGASISPGLKLYEQLLDEGKPLPVIYLAAGANVEAAVAAMKMGALDFLEKPLQPATLLARIETALALDSQWRGREEQFAFIERQFARLTSREAETLQMILAGDSNKSMAAKLFISERAVEMRRSRLMRKLKVRSMAELFEMAITRRLLSDFRRIARQIPIMEAFHSASAGSRTVL